MQMNMNFSNTTMIGLTRLIVLVACLMGWLMGRMTIGETALAMTTLLGALGSVGFFAAKDQGSPDTLATVTATEKDGKVKVAINAQTDEDAH
jgi:hypothetical protein